MQTKQDDCGGETRHFHARPDVQRKALLMFVVLWALMVLTFCLVGNAPYGGSPSLYFGIAYGIIPFILFVRQVRRRRPLISIGEKAISFWDYPWITDSNSHLWSDLEKRHDLENGTLVLYPQVRFGRPAKVRVPIDKLGVEDRKAVMELVETHLAVEAERIDCLACGETIEPALRHCPACGWTWNP